MRPSKMWHGLLLVTIGILIGVMAKPDAWLRALQRDDAVATDADRPKQVVELQRPMARPAVPDEPRQSALDTLHIELEAEAAERLQLVHDRSWKHGMIVQEEGDLVPASVRLGDRTVRARVRIKGDYLDHLSGDKWSLRVELRDGKLMGMSRFSIQHPKTRGYLWEWLVMQAARRDGLIAPRATFVNVIVNGNDVGMFYLEEHFTKELVESQGRREGPIVRFDEGMALGNEEQHLNQNGTLPPTTRRAHFPGTAEVGAFGEKRLAQAENLSRQLQEALNQLEVIQHWTVVNQNYIGAEGIARLQARIDQAARTIDDVLDVDIAARMHALMALFRCKHGLAWKNRRFYHNPITGLLEPIVFDTLAGVPIPERDPVAMYTYTTRAFMSSPNYHNRLFQHLADVANPDYLTGLFDEVGDDLELFLRLMEEEGLLPDTAASGTDIVRAQLYDQQVYLRELLRPRDGINFDARMLGGDDNQGELVIDTWSTTRVPIVLRGFYFTNGSFLAAQDALEPGALGTSRLRSEPGAVVLPHDGRHVSFRFPPDSRLATLRDVSALKSAALAGDEQDKSFKLQLHAEYRLITEEEDREELLWIRRFGPTWSDEGGRPKPPELQAALAAHEFLAYEAETRTLRIEPGTWDVEGDLVVPEGFTLHAGPGVTLRFAPKSALISNEPLLFEGTSESPIKLEPWTGRASFAGVCVLQAHGKSVWRNVHVRGTDVIRRAGWMMTGGVTFYHCPVELYDCRFDDAHGEDALNIFRAEFRMERVVIDTVASDAFDGDFVTGSVVDCTILNSVEDGVDVSGSDIDVTGCRFVNIGDKGISAGENSYVRVHDCVVESASIGAASKDFSRIEVNGLEVQQATNYGLAVYIKKPEFGASTIVGTNVTIGETGRGDYIVQETCILTLDGVSYPGVPLDVKELYRQKILGQ